MEFKQRLVNDKAHCAILNPILLGVIVALSGCGDNNNTSKSATTNKTNQSTLKCSTTKEIASAIKQLKADHNDQNSRFLGSPTTINAIVCRGGSVEKSQSNPWVDWGHYYATGDLSSTYEGRDKSPDLFSIRLEKDATTNLDKLMSHNFKGVTGALLDLEVQRMELINLNLFDNYTYETYVKGQGKTLGRNIKKWPEMQFSGIQLQKYSDDIVLENGEQTCGINLITHRTTEGICNDLYNPKMGSTNTLFARNVNFDATYPDLSQSEMVKNRHGNRLASILHPNPQIISYELFNRDAMVGATKNEQCNSGYGVILEPSKNGKPPTYSSDANCSYAKAPFFNVIAAFWIQFMTHDWFAHLKEGHNEKGTKRDAGCSDNVSKETGCSPKFAPERVLIEDDSGEKTFSHNKRQYIARSAKTTSNLNSAWWDASQIYGFDDTSFNRVIRSTQNSDGAKLKLVARNNFNASTNQSVLTAEGYLPAIDSCKDCKFPPHWRGQESAAFPDNWNIGLSFLHNLFVREHNSFVDAFRLMQKLNGNKDSGIVNKNDISKTKTYAEITDDELFEIARLVVSAEIAKIHTIEWTTQLLYNEPLYRGMNSNWYGLFNVIEKESDKKLLNKVIGKKESFTTLLSNRVGNLERITKANELYSALVSAVGIFGIGNDMEFNKDGLMRPKGKWSIDNIEHVNGGVNHFGSPFNFPEEFVSVYRLHPLVPDLIDFRGDLTNLNQITQKIPVVNTIRGQATQEMHRGIEQWGASMGRQRLGILALNNHPRFLQNLAMPHLGKDATLDIVALDILRDRERGIPKFNELRRQIGLKSLTSFDDFINEDATGDDLTQQQTVVKKLRKLYGTHTCDKSKIITNVQTNRAIYAKAHYQAAFGDQGKNDFIDDCLGHADGTEVDNIEDLDLVVGWLAESTRPHGFAISETQFHIFIINASRRLFSDRFFTSSFRPEFYSHFGIDWVNNNGPLDKTLNNHLTNTLGWNECGAPFSIEKLGRKIACMEPVTSNGHLVEVSPMKRILMRNIPALRDELIPVINAFDPWNRDRGLYYSLEWTPRKGAENDPAFNE
ncbi:peroxidase family protein [Flocculibacter collagenilyticus]|uniref:peroxidase family protein n=1 Tax=Flocculibacter collagenilyticus TaxID=2744479 RepID=UPI0018F612CF|nr:peroxidase family protein [Flocculibacter collagenilyticus]